MPHTLFKLFGRPSVYLEENDGGGNDLPGGKTAEELKAEADKLKADKEAAEKAEKDRLEAEAAQKAQDDKNKNPGAPSDAEAKLLKELMALKAREKAAQEELKSFKEAAGESKPEDLKALIEAKKAAERAEAEKRGEYDRIIEQVKTEHGKELERLRAELEETKLKVSEKDTSLLELTVGRAFSESPFIRERSVLPASIARKEFGAHVDIVDGAAVVYDKPRGAAERTPIVGADGKPKSFEEAIEVLYTKHPEASAMIRVAARPGANSKNTESGGRVHDGSQEIQPGQSRIAAGLKNWKKNQ